MNSTYDVLFLLAVTNGKHEIVPKDIREEAEKYAKVRSYFGGVSVLHLVSPEGKELTESWAATVLMTRKCIVTPHISIHWCYSQGGMVKLTV